jgi:RNA polymerase sigma factor (sigma-70 family)
MTWRQYSGNFDNPINPEYEQEARLVEQSRAGSERAFSALLARYQQPVFRLILYLVGDEEEARDLTRIAVKNALLHMPSVPAGYSIRPWLLRVAVLVALDAVRERSETPEQLLASMTLPAPTGPPRIVDADPADSDTMSLNLAHLEAAQKPDATVSDAWGELPIEIERELIRRLLSSLPESDAELLALGVVGQIPTRDLAALAGTSQRSIRRRIARALILFQSRYTSVRTAQLPAAAPARELPPTTATTPAAAAAGIPTAPQEIARRLMEATDRVRRGLQGTRQDAEAAVAEERLQTLRTGAVPPADVAPPSSDIPPVSDAETEQGDYQPYAPAANDAGDTGPLAGPPEPAAGTFDPQSYAAWTAPAPNLDAADPNAMTIPVPSISERDTLPPAAAATSPGAPEDTLVLPPDDMDNMDTAPHRTPALAATQPSHETQTETWTETWPPPPAADVAAPALSDSLDATIVRQATPDVQAPAPVTSATPSRTLPRFGPPPDQVLTDWPSVSMPDVPADSASAAPAAPAEDIAPPAEAHDVAAPPSAEDATTAAPPEADLVALAAAAAGVGIIAGVGAPAPDEAVPGDSAPAEVAPAADDSPVPARAEDVHAADAVQEAADPVDQDETAAPLESAAPAEDDHAESAVGFADVPPSGEDWPTEAEDTPAAADDAVAAVAPPFVASASADVDEVDAPVAEITNAPEQAAYDVAAANTGVPADALAAQVDDASSPDAALTDHDSLRASAADAAPASSAAEASPFFVAEEAGDAAMPPPAEPPLEAIAEPTEPPPTVSAFERDPGTEPPALKTGMGSTVVVPPLARVEYITRHRPAWLDAGDMGTLPGVNIDPGIAPDAAPTPDSPSVPVLGVHTVPPIVAPAGDMAPPSAEMPPDMADLADLTARPAPAADPVQEEGPSPVQRLRPPSRPMPRLERDIDEAPHEQ